MDVSPPNTILRRGGFNRLKVGMDGLTMFKKSNKRIVKIILILILFSFPACALTLISPGLNSNYRLDNLTGIRFEEAAFYGTKHYESSVFYLEFENLKQIINDTNNATFNKEERLDLNQFYKTDIHLMFELCYNKEKEINIFEDIKNYNFQLNNHSYESKISYFYPYSFYKRGSRISKKYPFYMNDDYPLNKVILKTGPDFLMCIRTILVFKKENQINNKNEFEILTPRNVHLFYSYEYKNQFIFYKNEGIDFSAK